MLYNQINISSGHSINCQGMNDIINEVTEARKVVDRIYEIAKANGKQCFKYHDTSSNSNQNLINIVNWHNQYKDGIDVSIHFNAYSHTNNAMGVEVCYFDEFTIASNVSKTISDVSGLKNRGAKKRTELYFLRNTNKPSILIEVCFGDSITDCKLYKDNFEKICQAIVKVLTGVAQNTTSNVSNSVVSNIKVGDRVKVKTTATHYATGQAIATFVKGNTYTVREVSSNKILLDGIMSWVLISDVDIVSSTSNNFTPYRVRITTDVLNVRADATTNSKIVTTVKKNEVYTIIGEKNDFLQLKSGAGYIHKDYTVKC